MLFSTAVAFRGTLFQFVTLPRTAVETAISEAHSQVASHCGRGPTLALLSVLAVADGLFGLQLRVGAYGGRSTAFPAPALSPVPLTRLMVSVSDWLIAQSGAV